MGINATRTAVQFLKNHFQCTTIVDPFCGRGTTLAIANEMGLDAIGVDIKAKNCEVARTLKNLNIDLEDEQGKENEGEEDNEED